jgi:methylenetetrahydrofolate dehydrogenase (NADP+)/methenyltetrahydrofolate cyclohydrolase
MGTIIDGKAIAAQVREQAALRVSQIIASGGRLPKLAVMLVGEDPRSAVYVRNKQRACENAGMLFELAKLPAETKQEALEAQIEAWDRDPTVDGILVQLPLPRGFHQTPVIERIAADKDVDGLTTASLKKMYDNRPGLQPATPRGIMKICEVLGVAPEGRRVVICGRGELVGRPLAMMMTNANATVTLCHSHTQHLKDITRQADILVTAIGKSRFFDSSYIREGAVVIDAGINVDAAGKLSGDCDWQEMQEKAGAVTPVPGGVGPMTIALLLDNVLFAYDHHEE